MHNKWSSCFRNINITGRMKEMSALLSVKAERAPSHKAKICHLADSDSNRKTLPMTLLAAVSLASDLQDKVLRYSQEVRYLQCRCPQNQLRLSAFQIVKAHVNFTLLSVNFHLKIIQFEITRSIPLTLCGKQLLTVYETLLMKTTKHTCMNHCCA